MQTQSLPQIRVLSQARPAVGDTKFGVGMTRTIAERVARHFYSNITAIEPVQSRVERVFCAAMNGQYDKCSPCPVFYDIQVSGLSEASVGMIDGKPAILHKIPGGLRELQILEIAG